MNNINKELLDAFGRIVYAIAKSDGEVQDEELNLIRQVVDKNIWAQELELSFEIERQMDGDAEQIFDEAIGVFKKHDAKEHYIEFVKLLEEIAKSHGGVVDEEKTLIDRFRDTLC
ncbi:MAG: TerB family tellurite resistance protein [Reichenbachiella sp.]